MGTSNFFYSNRCVAISDDDYNKVRSIPIAGNERFCELLIKYADKYFAPIYGK